MAKPAAPEYVVFDNIPAENLTVGTVIVEGKIDADTGELKRPYKFFKVLEFTQQGHEVHVKVRPNGSTGTLNWCYAAQGRVFVQ